MSGLFIVLIPVLLSLLIVVAIVSELRRTHAVNEIREVAKDILGKAVGRDEA